MGCPCYLKPVFVVAKEIVVIGEGSCCDRSAVVKALPSVARISVERMGLSPFTSILSVEFERNALL